MATNRIVYLSRAPVTDTSLIERGLEGLDYDLETVHVRSRGEALEAVKEADVVIAQGVPVDREVIEAMDRAQAIITPSHGFNHIDHNAATEKGIMVVNSAGFCTEEVSNHAILLLLACAKKLTQLHQLVREGRWTPETRGQILPIPPIDGQTLGLVALGNIARATARKAQALGMNVIAYDPYVPPWVAKEYRVRLVPTLQELAQESDFVSMHAPLNDETYHMLGEDFFRAMKPTAYFINTSRGPTVDEAALIKALQEGWIAGAGLDVFEKEPVDPDNPLLKMDNVVVTPHSAGTSNASRVASQLRVGQEIARILRGAWPMSVVNPEVRHRIAQRQPAVNVY